MVSNSWREVTHLWYIGWPEKGVPEEENSIIGFVLEARSYLKVALNVGNNNTVSSYFLFVFIIIFHYYQDLNLLI